MSGLTSSTTEGPCAQKVGEELKGSFPSERPPPPVSVFRTQDGEPDSLSLNPVLSSPLISGVGSRVHGALSCSEDSEVVEITGDWPSGPSVPIRYPYIH